MEADHRESDLCELVDACRDGDQSAWSRLITEFSPLVYSIPRRSGFSQEESEDVVQTVFALLVRKLDSIEDPQALPKWLSVTTQRACWREIRSGRARRRERRRHRYPAPIPIRK
ncbi:sigma factor [Phycisphaerales bacterium ac7]